MRAPDLSIGERIAIGFGVVLALLLIIVGIYTWADQRQADATRQLTELIMPRADAANSMETAYLRESAAVRSYISTGSDRYISQYHDATNLAADATSRLAKLPETPEGSALFAQIQPLARSYQQASDKAIALYQQGKTSEAQQVVEQEMAPARDQLLDKTEAFVSLQLQLRDQARAELDRVQEESIRLSLALALLALLCGAVIAYLVALSVRKPARALMGASRSLAVGDHASAEASAAAIAGPGGGRARNEIRQLASAFEFAAQELSARERRLSAQTALATMLASSVDVGLLAQRGLREVAHHVGAELGVVYLHAPEQAVLLPVGSFSMNLETLSPVKLGEGIPGEAAASRRTMLVRDIPADTPFRLGLGFDKLPPRWVASVPMTSHEELMGVLLLAGLRDLDKDSLEFVETGAQQLAVSLHNGLAHRSVERLAKDLQEKNELLSVQNEELQSQSEEIQAQNEELQSQSEGIQTQNEELQTQNEELEAQSEELAEQNRQLGEQAERIARLQAITLRLSESLSPVEVLDQVVATATDLTGSAIASVLLLDESKGHFTVAASVGLDEEQKASLRLSREESMAGQVLEQGRTLWLEDVSQEPQVRFPKLAMGEALGSIVVAPVMAHGEPLGVVEVYYTAPREFSGSEVELLSSLGAAAAIAIHNSQTFEATNSQKRMLESILAQIPEAVFVTDEQGRTITANDVAREMFGVEPGEMPPVADGGDGDVASADVWRAVGRAVSGEPLLAEIVPYRTTSGSQDSFAQLSVVPIVGNTGVPTSFVAVAADVTRFKELERAKDEFLSVISHELKSPLTSVKGYAQLMERRLAASGEESRTKMTRTIVDQADRVVRLIDRLLDLSRIQMGRLEMRLEPVDLAELVRAQVQAAQVKTDEHRLVADTPAEVVGTWDRAYVGQVISNLLDNAVRYSPEGGEVRVSVRRENGSAVLQVSDQGIGIPADAQTRIFERHFRTREAKRVKADGLGIGLYLVREIVTAHHGRIEVSSEVGGGTTFTVELPLGDIAAES